MELSLCSIFSLQPRPLHHPSPKLLSPHSVSPFAHHTLDMLGVPLVPDMCQTANAHVCLLGSELLLLPVSQQIHLCHHLNLVCYTALTEILLTTGLIGYLAILSSACHFIYQIWELSTQPGAKCAPAQGSSFLVASSCTSLCKYLIVGHPECPIECTFPP